MIEKYLVKEVYRTAVSQQYLVAQLEFIYICCCMLKNTYISVRKDTFLKNKGKLSKAKGLSVILASHSDKERCTEVR